jgi:serine/threonine-protein kinase
VRQPLEGARAAFGLDELWRPAACEPERFAALGPELVRDLRTRLVWERGGSAYGLTYAAAQARAGRLNAERRHGLGGWRLPTAEELATLLLPEPDLRQLCLPPAFGPSQRRIWTADRKSFTAAWYADVEHGFVWWQDVTCEFFARCVTSEEAQKS